jgi:hypothetical protein
MITHQAVPNLSAFGSGNPTFNQLLDTTSSASGFGFNGSSTSAFNGFGQLSANSSPQINNSYMQQPRKAQKKVKRAETAPMFSAPRPMLHQDTQMSSPPRPTVQFASPPRPIIFPTNQEVFTSMSQPKDPNDVKAMMERLTPTELQLVLTRVVMHNPDQAVAVKKQILLIQQARQQQRQQ